MKSFIVNLLISGSLLSGLAVPACAQADCFARVTLDRHSVYVQQPFKVTITVLTATWYTAALTFDNIQVPNAFILSFDRTTPGMFEVAGKHYAGLQFYYIVFPYREGEFVFPAIDIIAQTPAPGTSQSREIRISTPVQRFSVKPVPADVKGDWFVAKDVAISEHWSRPLQDLKVGDVVGRTIGIRASGTLPQFIHPLPDQSLDFANVYLQEAGLRDQRNDYDAGGSLTQRVVYLLDKEGDFVLPEVNVQWWNPNSSKLYSRSAAAVKIHVKANPELGMLATLRDSLGARAVKKAIVAGGAKRRIFGMDWYWALLILLSAPLLIFRIVKILTKQWRNYKRRHTAWLAGEDYAFRLFMRSATTIPSFIGAMYRWWDRFPLPKASFSITVALRQNERLREEIKDCLGRLYGPETGDMQVNGLKNELRLQRRKWKWAGSGEGDPGISMFQHERKKNSV